MEPDRNMDLGAVIPELLKKHTSVRRVDLTGSRLAGGAAWWSDWDFLVEVTDFGAVSVALPALTKRLEPLSHLWDPLSLHAVYMMILKGPTRVDVIFNRPHQQEPPWIINSDTIALVNSHFWDWILWLAGKEARGTKNMVTKELEKMYGHLLAPLGCARSPGSIEEAVRDYLAAFKRQKSRFHTEVDPALGIEVIKGLKMMGFQL
jgi:hypothetical protein